MVAIKQRKLEKQAKNNEVCVDMLFFEHNLALPRADHLVDLVKTMDLESKVLQKMKGGRTKATAIAQEVIRHYSYSQITVKLKTEIFSMYVFWRIYRSTVGTNRNLFVMVRFLLNSKLGISV